MDFYLVLISGFLFVMSDSSNHMSNIKNEKFIVRVIRKRTIETPAHKDSTSQASRIDEKADPIYEQEFDTFDIANFATRLNRKEKKEGKEKDDKSLKMGESGAMSE